MSQSHTEVEHHEGIGEQEDGKTMKKKMEGLLGNLFGIRKMHSSSHTSPSSSERVSTPTIHDRGEYNCNEVIIQPSNSPQPTSKVVEINKDVEAILNRLKQ